MGKDGQVHIAEADALTPEDLAAVQQQVRARVGPPLWDSVAEPVPAWQDALAAAPEYVFDQRLSW
jgi:hypothetical protein